MNMPTNKWNNSKKESASRKSQNIDELNDTEEVSMQDRDGISIYWGDEWNIEKGEEKKKK